MILAADDERRMIHYAAEQSLLTDSVQICVTSSRVRPPQAPGQRPGSVLLPANRLLNLCLSGAHHLARRWRRARNVIRVLSIIMIGGHWPGHVWHVPSLPCFWTVALTEERYAGALARKRAVTRRASPAEWVGRRQAAPQCACPARCARAGAGSRGTRVRGN
eukprot:3813407-Rhodomonas_salina.1